jgi:hypothetical protein
MVGPRQAFAGLKLNVFVDDRLNIGSRTGQYSITRLGSQPAPPGVRHRHPGTNAAVLAAKALTTTFREFDPVQAVACLNRPGGNGVRCERLRLLRFELIVLSVCIPRLLVCWIISRACTRSGALLSPLSNFAAGPLLPLATTLSRSMLSKTFPSRTQLRARPQNH